MPTALERAGDFSQTRDNLGNPYPYIKDPNITGACTAADQTACFRDGGVLGRIPADRLYQPGLNILKMWPMPNDASTATGRNYAITRPAESILGYQPAVRVDYQPTSSLRVSVKYSGRDSAAAGRSTARFPASTIRRWCTRASAPKASRSTTA